MTETRKLIVTTLCLLTLLATASIASAQIYPPLHTTDRGTAELQYIEYLSGQPVPLPYGWSCQIITPFEFGPDGALFAFYGGVYCVPQPWFVDEVKHRERPSRTRGRK